MKLFKLLVCLSLMFVSQSISAVSIEWEFINSGETWGVTDTITLKARLTNTGAETLVLGGYVKDVRGAQVSIANSTTDAYDFNFIFQDELKPFPDETWVLAGESFEFNLAELVPYGVTRAGRYGTHWEKLSLADGTYVDSLNSFEAFVVPLPPAMLLMVSGLVVFGIKGFRKNCG